MGDRIKWRNPVVGNALRMRQCVEHRQLHARHTQLRENASVDEFNERLIGHVQQEGRVMLSGTRIDGSFRLRCAILCFRTHLEHVDEAVDALVRGVAVLDG